MLQFLSSKKFPAGSGLLAVARGLTAPSVAIIASLPWILGAGPELTAETLASRRQAIAAMSDSQRQELLRKYETFQKLDDAEKNRLRRFHRELENSPDLKETLNQYCEWLKGLSSAKKQLLRDAETAEKRRRLVEEFRTEELRKSQPTSHFVQELIKSEMPMISGEDLKSVMMVLESDLLKTGVISAEQQQTLESLQGTVRYKQLVKFISLHRFPKGEPRREFQIPESTRAALFAVIKDDRIRPLLRVAERNSGRVFPQEKLLMILFKSTVVEANNELQNRPTETMKAEIFKSLNPEDQERFLQFPPDEQEERLKWFHFDEIRRTFAEAGGLPPRPPGEGPGGKSPGGHGGFLSFPPFPGGFRDPGIRPPKRPEDVFDRPAAGGNRPSREGRSDGRISDDRRPEKRDFEDHPPVERDQTRSSESSPGVDRSGASVRPSQTAN